MLLVLVLLNQRDELCAGKHVACVLLCGVFVRLFRKYMHGNGEKGACSQASICMFCETIVCLGVCGWKWSVHAAHLGHVCKERDQVGGGTAFVNQILNATNHVDAVLNSLQAR